MGMWLVKWLIMVCMCEVGYCLFFIGIVVLRLVVWMMSVLDVWVVVVSFVFVSGR